MSQTEAGMRWAGALAALVAASTLMGFPAVEARADVVLVLHAILLLGCAAVLLSTAHGAVAELARGATEDARRTALAAAANAPSGSLRWFGFAATIVPYALHVDGDVAAAEAEAPPPDTVKGFLLFLLFLAGVWAVYLSMVRDRAGPPPWPPAPAAAVTAVQEDPDGGEVNAVAPLPARVVVDLKL